MKKNKQLIELLKNDVNHLEWDFNKPKDSVGTTKDWIQTLITGINQVSAKINKLTFRGGGDEIKIHPELLILFRYMKYITTNNDGKIFLAGRYEIITDSKIPKGLIYIITNKDDIGKTGDFIMIPEISKICDESEITELTLKLYSRLKDVEKVEEYENKKFGTIEVLNYTYGDYVKLSNGFTKEEKDKVEKDGND